MFFTVFSPRRLAARLGVSVFEDGPKRLGDRKAPERRDEWRGYEAAQKNVEILPF